MVSFRGQFNSAIRHHIIYLRHLTLIKCLFYGYSIYIIFKIIIKSQVYLYLHYFTYKLNNYLEQLLPDNLRELFLREAIDMSKDKFILHEWQYDKMQDLEKKKNYITRIK